jgi:Ca2+-binding EF-hand superfamily protein
MHYVCDHALRATTHSARYSLCRSLINRPIDQASIVDPVPDIGDMSSSMEAAMRSLLTLSLGIVTLTALPLTAQASGHADQVARSIAEQTLQMQDRDSDGRISLKESAGAALSLFQTIDSDQSQLISSAEMLEVAMKDTAALRISSTVDQTAALVQSRFQVMDIDGDGEISLPEMLAVTETVFDAADSNSDGYVSKAELTALALKRPVTEEAR